MKISKTPKTFLVIGLEREMTLGVFESYATVSNRLLSGSDFFQVTGTDGKRIINKKSLMMAGVVTPEMLPETITVKK